MRKKKRDYQSYTEVDARNSGHKARLSVNVGKHKNATFACSNFDSTQLYYLSRTYTNSVCTYQYRITDDAIGVTISQLGTERLKKVRVIYFARHTDTGVFLLDAFRMSEKFTGDIFQLSEYLGITFNTLVQQVQKLVDGKQPLPLPQKTTVKKTIKTANCRVKLTK